MGRTGKTPTGSIGKTNPEDILRAPAHPVLLPAHSTKTGAFPADLAISRLQSAHLKIKPANPMSAAMAVRLPKVTEGPHRMVSTATAVRRLKVTEGPPLMASAAMAARLLKVTEGKPPKASDATAVRCLKVTENPHLMASADMDALRRIPPGLFLRIVKIDSRGSRRHPLAIHPRLRLRPDHSLPPNLSPSSARTRVRRRFWCSTAS